MNSFTVKDGHFWIDDQPILLQAGEFHYFRTPADQWAHRLQMLKDAGFNTLAAYIPWLWHQPAPDVSDVDGHTHPMRDLAGFLDLATSMGFWIIPRPGPYIMAETINEGVPPWVFERYPAAAFVSQDGKVQNIASYLHPDFLRCVEAWYAAVFEVISPRQVTWGGRVLLVQLDNEMGMIPWVRNIIDTNPDTLARFAAYLRAAYGDSLVQRYPAADLPAFLREQITQPGAPHSVTVIEDYRRFYRGYLRDYMRFLWDQARSHGMDVPPVVNIHGFGNGGKTFPIGLSQLVDVMALDGMISATDVYPLYIGEGNFHQLLLVNEMTKALHNPDQALFSIEFQSGGNLDFGTGQTSLYDLHTRLCVSVGMRAINHYLFFDGENDPILSPVKRHNWGQPVRKDGTPRRHYARYGELSRVLSAYGADLVRARPKTVTTIGFLIDAYMTEVNSPLTRPAADVLTHQRDVILFDFLARGLAITQRPFDALELARAPLDPTRTPLLWVMLDKQCDPPVQRKLVEYVRGGGKLVVVGRLPETDFDHAPCTLLQETLGVEIVRRDPPFTPTTIQIYDDPSVPISFLEAYAGAFDEVFAATSDGQTVGFVKRLGAGEMVMLGAALTADTLEDIGIVDRIAARMGCAPAFTLSDWADVRVSEGENGFFVYANNYQDDPIETVITSDNVALFGGAPIHIPARRGVILPLNWRVKPGVTVHFLTSEVTGVTEINGRLTLTTALPAFTADLRLDGWHCDESLIVGRGDDGRVTVRGQGGVLILERVKSA